MEAGPPDHCSCELCSRQGSARLRLRLRQRAPGGGGKAGSGGKVCAAAVGGCPGASAGILQRFVAAPAGRGVRGAAGCAGWEAAGLQDGGYRVGGAAVSTLGMWRPSAAPPPAQRACKPGWAIRSMARSWSPVGTAHTVMQAPGCALSKRDLASRPAPAAWRPQGNRLPLPPLARRPCDARPQPPSPRAPVSGSAPWRPWRAPWRCTAPLPARRAAQCSLQRAGRAPRGPPAPPAARRRSP